LAEEYRMLPHGRPEGLPRQESKLDKAKWIVEREADSAGDGASAAAGHLPFVGVHLKNILQMRKNTNLPGNLPSLKPRKSPPNKAKKNADVQFSSASTALIKKQRQRSRRKARRDESSCRVGIKPRVIKIRGDAGDVLL
jgi:hypothetical protein